MSGQIIGLHWTSLDFIGHRWKSTEEEAEAEEEGGTGGVTALSAPSVPRGTSRAVRLTVGPVRSAFPKNLHTYFFGTPRFMGGGGYVSTRPGASGGRGAPRGGGRRGAPRGRRGAFVAGSVRLAAGSVLELHRVWVWVSRRYEPSTTDVTPIRERLPGLSLAVQDRFWPVSGVSIYPAGVSTRPRARFVGSGDIDLTRQNLPRWFDSNGVTSPKGFRTISISLRRVVPARLARAPL